MIGLSTDSFGRGLKVGLLAVSAAIAMALPLAMAAPANAAGTVYVTFGFDDGLTSQFQNRDVLKSYGFPATYYINSGAVGTGNRMSWTNLHTLQNDGNEIAAHSKNHEDLTDPSTDLNEQVCGAADGDLATFQANGFSPTDFAYPYGRFNSTVIDKLKACGYRSARTTQGIDTDSTLGTGAPGSDTCTENPATLDLTDCLWSESPTIQPSAQTFNIFALKAAENHLHTRAGAPWDWTDGDTTGVKGRITRARDYRGGWVNIVLHDICTQGLTTDANNCTDSTPAPDDYEIPRNRLDKLAAWIATQSDVKVRTTAQMVDMFCAEAPSKCPPPQTGGGSGGSGGGSVGGAGGATLSVNPLAKISSARKGSKRRWKLTIRLARPASAKQVKVLVDGRVAKTLNRLSASQTLTLKIGSGKHKLKLSTTATDGKVYTSATKTIGSKSKKKSKKK